MNYELAKALKDAGFPQKQEMAYWMKHDAEEPFAIHPQWDNRTVQSYREGYPLSEVVAAPTLEELIEACGDKLYTIKKVHRGGERGWIAGKDAEQTAQYVRWDIMEFGPTINIALTNLWLTLNKKNTNSNEG